MPPLFELAIDQESLTFQQEQLALLQFLWIPVSIQVEVVFGLPEEEKAEVWIYAQPRD